MIEFNDLKGITPESNPLYGSSGGEMAAPTVRHIPVDRIRPDPEQPRRQVSQEGPEWEGLLASVSKYGVLQPILVRPEAGRRGHYILVCGERRWRAARALGLPHITARIMRDGAMLDHRAEIQLLENSLREGLSPFDELDACVKFLEGGRKQCELAELLGVTRGRVSQILSLQRIDPVVRAYLGNRPGIQLSRRKLLRVAGRSGAREQLELAQKLSGVGGAPSPQMAATAGGDGPTRRVEPTSFDGENFAFELAPLDNADGGDSEGDVRVTIELFGIRGVDEVARVLKEAARKVYRAKHTAVTGEGI